MKKSSAATSSPSGNLQELLQKYDAEKQLLLKQNQELEQRIFKQISENHHLKQTNDQLTSKVQKYKRELAQKEKRILLLEAEQSDLLSNNNHGSSYSEEQYKTLLNEFNQAVNHIKLNEEQMERLQSYLKTERQNSERMHRKCKQLENDSVEIKKNMEMLTQIHQQHLGAVAQLTQDLKDRQQKNEQLQQIKTKLQSKYKDKKKKFKQLQNDMAQQQIKYKNLLSQHKLQTQALKNELIKQKQKFQKIQNQLTTKNTTIQFQKLQLAKNQLLLNNQKQQEEQHQQQKSQRGAELQIKCSTLTIENTRLTDQVDTLHSELRQIREQLKVIMYSYEIAYKNLKTTVLKQFEAKVGSTQQLLLRVDKLVDQIRLNSNKEAIILKLKEQVKQLESQTKHLKQGSKSKSKQAKSQSQRPTQDLKFQNQLILKQMEMKLLENQVSQLKSFNESNLHKLIESKKTIETLQKKLEKQENQNKRRQDVYTNEMKKCLNQLYQYKDKVAQMKESEKEEMHFREVAGTKINTYEKKTKELLESIERKEQLISKLKQNKRQNQQIIDALQQKFGKLDNNQELVRKLRNDLSRKDQLMSGYKSKFDASKHEVESLKDALQKLQKHALHTQKQLQRKSSYINTMKDKYQKQMSQIEKKLKSNSDHTKSISNVMEHKLISIKKECLNYQQLIEDIKKCILGIIEQLKDRQLQTKPVKKKKKQNNNSREIVQNAKQWQATKVLGLKQSELQDFINPKPQKINRKIYQDREQQLQKVWVRGDVLQYIQSAMLYIVEIVGNEHK